jgi:hypothetical protein
VDDSVVRGIELVRDQFLAKLEAFGISRFPALRRPFDALRHEAVTTAPVEHPSQDGWFSPSSRRDTQSVTRSSARRRWS